MMNYRTVSDLSESVREWSMEFGDDIDLIVGIPRSGLLVANLMVLYRNLPMTDVVGLRDGRLIDTGYRHDIDLTAVSDVDRVLVVDDSVNTGREMRETRAQLERHDFPFEIEYGAVYASVDGHQYVDHWHEVVSQPRVFEWNIMHHPRLKNWCVDIDGVLCRDPTTEENDDGERYREFITTVDSRVVPSKEIGWLVTCRLEKYREETEAWLDAHGIEYDELVMMDHPSKEARQEAGNHAEYKAETYDSTGADLFIESSPQQAAEIAERTGKPVYCFESNRMVEPGRLPRTHNTVDTYLSRFVESPLSFSREAVGFVYDRGRARLRLAFDRYRDG